MALEFFGTQISHYVAVCVVIAFLITGHRSVFLSQRIEKFSKAENIKIEEGGDIEHTEISVNTKDIEKIKHIKNRLRYKSLKWQAKQMKDDKKL